MCISAGQSSSVMEGIGIGYITKNFEAAKVINFHRMKQINVIVFNLLCYDSMNKYVKFSIILIHFITL